MEIDNHVSGIVQTIISQITAQVQQQVASQIDQRIAEIIDNLDTTSILANQLSQKLDQRINQLPLDTNSIEAFLKTRLDNVTSTLTAQIQERSVATAQDYISQQVNNINFRDLCQSALTVAIQQQSFAYPANSIPGSAIDPAGWRISGDNVSGGIIANFGSTGIDDRASACQVTVMDDVTVIENNLLTRDLTVKGTTTIEGDLNVTGTVPETSPMYISIVDAATNNVKSTLTRTLFDGFTDTIFQQIKDNGLDLGKITVNGETVIDGANLGNKISYSNLQKVGTLQELQVEGETLLSQSLYVTRGRVGINTIEPAQALSIWDQEVEVGFSKQTTNTAVFGTPRNQTLVLSSNGKNNVTLTADGATTVNQLNIGAISITSGSVPPTTDQPKGTIVFNENPTLGGPMGWVSLGNARWANFGVID